MLSFIDNLKGRLARTSGVLLMAGVGSYCAYRMCRRFLGKDFVWTLLDSAKCDMLSRADCRLLHPAAEGFYTVRLGEDDLQQIQEFLLRNTQGSLVSVGRSGRRSSCSSTASNWRRLGRQQEKGLASLLMDLSSAVEMTKNHLQLDHEDDEDARSITSEMSSVSHQHAHQPHPKQARSHRNRLWSLSTAASEGNEDDESVASASLRIVWQGEQDWEDEFQVQEYREQSSTPSGISQLSAFKNLEKMFSQKGQHWQEELEEDPGWMSQQQLHHQPTTSSIYGEEVEQNNPATSKCLYSDTDYMYHSVTVERGDIAASEVMSMCSGRSGCSNLSNVHHRQRTPSHGLWELTSESRRSTPEKSGMPQGLSTQSGSSQVGGSSRRQTSKNQMTDSCFSKSSFASSSASSASLSTKMETSQRLTTPKSKPSSSAMFDSAIGMESESLMVGAETDCSQDSKQLPSDTFKDELSTSKGLNPGILRRNWLLDGIEESESSPQHYPQTRSKSSSTSLSEERSLEWF
uniref:Uncharacterized protein n=1 Tax=Ditylenchus dipsaci TaxID=166011 RepID=A0A915ER17_9BILA